MRALALLAIAACGRVGFDAQLDGGDPDASPPRVLAQTAFLKAANADAGDRFGQVLSISADGNTLVVGAPGEDSATRTDPSDNSVPDAGAAYVFARSGDTWTQRAYLKALHPDPNDELGYAVAISGDGSTIAVGALDEASAATGVDGDQMNNAAPGAGAVYIFVAPDWTPQAYLKASNTNANDQFGTYLAFSDDGNTLAVGARGEGSGSLLETDNSAPAAGAAYVFVRSGALWSQQAYLKSASPGPNDQFGISVAVSGAGSTLAVSAPNEDGLGNDPTINSAMDSGGVFMFARSGTIWTRTAYIKPVVVGPGDTFGAQIALSGDGTLLAAGAPFESSDSRTIDGDEVNNNAFSTGAGYVLDGPGWSHQVYLKASNADPNDSLGYNFALAPDGATVAFGAEGEASASPGVAADPDDNTASGAGAAYVFQRTGASWRQTAYLKASNPDANDMFGDDLALSGTGVLAIGSRGEASAPGAPQSDNSMPLAGAVYVFSLP